MRWTERKLTPPAFASIRPVHWVASPRGGPSARSRTRCTVSAGSGFLPGFRVLSRVNPSTPSAIKRACHAHTTGFDLPDRRMISVVPQPSAVQDDVGAPHILLRRAPVCDNRLKPTAVASRDVNDDSCSHPKSMNYLRRFGNRLNESHH